MKLKSIIILFASLLFCSSLFSQTWYSVESNTTEDLEAIQFLEDEPTIGFIGGENVLLKTTDSGVTWTPVDINSLPADNSVLDIHDVHFFDELTGFVTSDYQIWETSDGGLNWTVAPIQFNCFAVAMYFINDDLGFFGGSGCFEGHVIVRLENEEDFQVSTPEDWFGASINHVSSIEFKDELFGLAGTISGNLLRTTDGGLNWDTIPNLANGETITGFVFNEDEIIATHQSNENFGTMSSSDNGLTWSMHEASATFFYPAMDAAHKSESEANYLGGRYQQGGVIFSNEGGFWNFDAVEFPVRDIDSQSESRTFCVGEQGAIYVNADPDETNNINEHFSNSLGVYPNPSSSLIHFTGDLDGLTKYEIYSVEGKLVMEEQSYSPASTQIDVSELERGPYFIKLISNNGIGSIQFIKE
ncbi:MAG: T9SS type A sorting domain-containing protein [Flavobacteriales bacterium]